MSEIIGVVIIFGMVVLFIALFWTAVYWFIFVAMRLFSLISKVL